MASVGEQAAITPEANLTRDRFEGDGVPTSDVSEAGLITRIRPPTGWQLINVRELWRFRELLYFLVWRDVKIRYKQTLLGAIWAVLQPAMMMLVFTIFFHRVAGLSSGGVPYPLFAYAGLLPWTFFSASISNSGSSVVSSERLITKIYFPRLLIPFAAVGAAVVDFLIAMGMLVLLMFWYGVTPGAHVMLAPLIFLVIVLGALGIGAALSALNVLYRDFRYVIPFLVQFWMFATPTIYVQMDSRSTSDLSLWLALNPMTNLIASFRSACLGGPIDWMGLMTSTGCMLVIFFAGYLYFRRLEHRFADVV